MVDVRVGECLANSCGRMVVKRSSVGTRGAEGHLLVQTGLEKKSLEVSVIFF